MPARPKRSPRHPLVWVRWIDASYNDGELRLDEMRPLIEIESAGLLVREDDESVSLALDWYPGEKTWRHIAHIPRINIRSIRKF